MNHADQFRATADASGLGALRFDTPWSARLFGMTLAAAEKGLFTLADFQTALILAIQQHEEKGCIESDEQYYTSWLQALESLLRSRKMIDDALVAEREADLAHAAHERHENQRKGMHIGPEAAQ